MTETIALRGNKLFDQFFAILRISDGALGAGSSKGFSKTGRSKPQIYL
jgi:hypothetical protein